MNCQTFVNCVYLLVGGSQTIICQLTTKNGWTQKKKNWIGDEDLQKEEERREKEQKEEQLKKINSETP